MLPQKRLNNDKNALTQKDEISTIRLASSCGKYEALELYLTSQCRSNHY